MEWYVYKRESGGTYIINLKITWKELLLAAHAIFAVENQADVNITLPRDTGQRVVLKLAAASGATLVAGSSLLETSLTRSWQLSRNQGFWWLLIPGLTTNLSQRHLMLTC
ncbi:40S ribosomal protein SA [Galemys pyrenaicus]|uniref:40S ribosomal protein SA n=1 Tax=Galemys pyrenaicus TaxID=202257 RepID=A0A8J6ACR1_GALPY|nr:40S ribosomal protein SA [Galemys pyrenaicus]